MNNIKELNKRLNTLTQEINKIKTILSNPEVHPQSLQGRNLQSLLAVCEKNLKTVSEELSRSVPKRVGEQYYEESDGWFTYYVNVETKEKKFKLDEGDVLIQKRRDDFMRM